MATLMKKTTFKTELNADCIEWCPINNFHDLFVCGTYQLSENEENVMTSEKKRVGYLYLFKFSNKFNGFLKVLQKLSMPGILDCKWCHVKLQNNVFLALVNAVGELRILLLDGNGDETLLQEVHKVKLTSNEDTLLLSLDWSTGITDSVVKVVVSSSSGHVTMVSFSDGSFYKHDSWKLHDFEAWIVAFNYWNVNLFFSGGDDCKLKCFDTRVGQVVSTNTSHEAGVTSLHMNFKKENSLISGSYDENIRFWDVRNMKKHRNQISTGGGVWRLKWEPKLCLKISASCMYSGSVVVDAVDEKIIATYKEHASINYGIDWSFISEETIFSFFNIENGDEVCNYNIISVCSFYDNLISLALLKSPK
ncbi:diphthine methyltransferase isoform X2 [Rhodnius prolixus]